MTTCPKCNYTRTASDTNPDWQCPKCEIVYAKYSAPDVAARTVSVRQVKEEESTFWGRNWWKAATAGIGGLVLYKGAVAGSHIFIMVGIAIALIPLLLLADSSGDYWWSDMSWGSSDGDGGDDGGGGDGGD